MIIRNNLKAWKNPTPKCAQAFIELNNHLFTPVLIILEF